MKYYFLALVLTAMSIKGLAQDKNEQAYRKASAEIKQQVFAWDKPQFHVRDIPKEYANASKVVIARHTELTSESKSGIAFYFGGIGSKRELNILEIVREVIKLNDKAAVEYYSELAFTKFARTSGFYTSEKLSTYVGIRIIKPNGKVTEINADDVVLTRDDPKNKKAKIAVPNLEPGDIIDYYIASDQQLVNEQGAKEYRILLFDDAPILNLSFHGELGKKMAILYRSYNNAPDLKIGKNNDKEIIIDVQKDNIPAYETALWIAPARQLPFIRMSISLGYSGLGAKYNGTRRPGEILKLENENEILDDIAQDYSESYYYNYWLLAGRKQYGEIEKTAQKKAKQMGLKYKDLTDDEKAALLFYTFRGALMGFDINRLSETLNIGSREYNGAAFPLFAIMKVAGMEPAILLSEHNRGYRLKDAMSRSDLQSLAYLPGSKKYFSINTIFDFPFKIPDFVEGVQNTKSITFSHPVAVGSMKKIAGMSNVATGPRIPASMAKDNLRQENLRLSINDDISTLRVKRNTILKGHYKLDAQQSLALYEDIYESERKSFGDKESLLEALEDGKKSKKYVEEVKNAFAEARKNQKTAFVNEAKEWFEQDVTDLKDHKVTSLGIRHTEPDFVYSSSFNLDGLVKKAGNNIIVEVGKIQGQPLSIKDNNRNRTIDVYMPFARGIEYVIELEIPIGYTVEGVQELNKNVSNETGLFIVEATTANNIITIKVKKHYTHNFEPAANFTKMLSFLDAADEWTNAKLLFKKAN
ncbi:hypothetical protein ACFS6H_09570 [Terrimonas rubra]|uniref:DUF3857 domain-containing protein n=1 Tax=Terrimonas rubra TaxID=1035890 RepID=A0ABW6A6A5_9BACT